eukprot:Phypoly_transcript_11841.p1 GENE.Phypoly_transcript_11841~~Phypoly_transcript_11841.p1  ORF type:complete len:310 (+),score=70.31 Phypoly_transcript_11841:85-1014(+)
MAGTEGSLRVVKNEAGKYASRMMKSEIAQTDGKLWSAYQLLVKGQAIYLPNFFCEKDDFKYLQALSQDLQKNAGEGMINWSQHLKHENPDFSPTFQEIVQKMADYFDLEIYATRLNFYPDTTSWKPFHHDSHAYGNRSLREDFTVGASFGATRELVFMHPPSQQQFSFPQQNGDIFAFTTSVNQAFMHGVPKATGIHGAAPRFSIIAWGRRKSLNERNSGTDELGKKQVLADESEEDAKSEKNSKYDQKPEKEKEQAMGIAEVTALVDKFVLANTKKPVAASAAKFVLANTKKHVAAAAAKVCISNFKF